MSYSFESVLRELDTETPKQYSSAIASKASNTLRYREDEWYKDGHSAAEDAARWILDNDIRILLVPNAGWKTLKFLQRFAEGVISGELIVEVEGNPETIPMPYAMFDAYNKGLPFVDILRDEAGEV